MSANIESMFYAGRETPWHGLGKAVDDALTSADALRMAGLDWAVIREDIHTPRGEKINGWKSNIRRGAQQFDDAGNEIFDAVTGKPLYHADRVLGIMSDRYTIVQNRDAFAFTDNLVGGGDVRYETAGSLKGGRLVWLLAKMPETDILGDKVEPYLCFSNSHDGSSTVRVCCTPIRVVCNNTLNLALASASRVWAVRHTGELNAKLNDAKAALNMAKTYMNALDSTANKFVNSAITEKEYREFVEELFPLPKDADAPENKRRKENTVYLWNLVNFCYIAEDIKQFHGTKWGAINAVSDAVYHGTPRRETQNYKANLWYKSMSGNAILDKAMELLA